MIEDRCEFCKCFHKLKHNFIVGKGFEESWCCTLFHEDENGWVQQVPKDGICEEFARKVDVKKLKVKIKRLSETAKIPTRGSEYAAGYDLYADIKERAYFSPHEVKKIPTGIAMEIPHGYFGAVFPRSGLATKRSLNLVNNVAVIDEDYRGEWFLPILNESTRQQTIDPGERIAQLIILPYKVLDFEEVENLSDTDRGEGGFGSTGTK